MSVDGFFGGVVVPFARARKNMTQTVLEEIRAYWETLRASRTVPLRSEIDPRGIEAVLDHAFILERVAPQIARFRVAGGQLNDLMGMEVRGMPITAMFTSGSRPRMGAVIADLFDTPTVAELALVAETGPGRQALTGRLLLLPMASDRGGIDRALGCLATTGPIGLAPRRFTIADARRTEIITGHPISLPRSGVSGFSEHMPAFTGPERRRGHLRLVKSDE
ncbi:PAS domain-containing protein [Defluviimonas sp. WL0002]|uniref:PAS domain-containing protein n=1 Tax=Albidovulum marisflavi TaxID=2984159 RepID=A0ABT2ZG92_9RHOB|nr:PAS domain-containing protein [Defluviimonas sp. WL0002]MCV2870037.1 PAS domain-containing protein [Defluviimonas sp. WL0002]